MPSRNIEKVFIAEAYYHVYNRGVEKRHIFMDDEDYRVFLNLLKRYLKKEPSQDLKGRVYPNFYGDLELLAYCLMPNHFHLFMYQDQDASSVTALMRGVCTSYTGYFNKKYKRVGHLFQDRFKASQILSDNYLIHISRYIHLNPKNYESWPYSSYNHYISNRKADWVRPDRVLELFEGESYASFVADYKDHKETLDEIKANLAYT